MVHAHEFEQLDNGFAYCVGCTTTLGEFNELSADPRTIKTEEPRIRLLPAQPKPVENVTLELQKIRRELLTLANRIDKVVQGQETA